MKALVLALSVLLSACVLESVDEVQTDNNVRLELLFNHEGCKVYRFWDFNEPQYFADCRP